MPPCWPLIPHSGRGPAPVPLDLDRTCTPANLTTLPELHTYPAHSHSTYTLSPQGRPFVPFGTTPALGAFCAC